MTRKLPWKIVSNPSVCRAQSVRSTIAVKGYTNLVVTERIDEQPRPTERYVHAHSVCSRTVLFEPLGMLKTRVSMSNMSDCIPFENANSAIAGVGCQIYADELHDPRRLWG